MEFSIDNDITNKPDINKVMDEKSSKIRQKSQKYKSREVSYSSEDFSSLLRDISRKNMNSIKIGFVTGISDFYKLVVTVYGSYSKLPPKNILYRNVKRFQKATFRQNLDSKLIQGELYNNCQEPYKLT